MPHFKSRNKTSKAMCQRLHAKRRAVSRYGTALMAVLGRSELNRFDRREIIEMIQSGRATLVEKQSNRVSIYNLWFKQIPVQIVYDKLRAEIVSFLPPENLLRNSFASHEQLEALGLVDKPVVASRFMAAIEKMNGEVVGDGGSDSLDSNSSDVWSGFEI